MDGPNGAIRMMGLAMSSNGLFVVAGSLDVSFLAIFNHRLEQTGWYELPGASDPHGLVVEGQHLWVVSSRTNQVIRYKMSVSGAFVSDTVFEHTDVEPQHFNGLVRHDGGLILSALGVSGQQAHEVKSTGYLIDIERSQQIRTGLDQPHSPYSYNSSFFFCESRSSVVWRNNEPLARLNGYLRGLVVAADGLLHVAESAQRPRREQLTDRRPDATIWTLSSDGRVLARHTLVGLGPEIYDLVGLP